MAKIYTLSSPKDGWQFRFSWEGFALFYGDFPRRTFQLHWWGYIGPCVIYGDCLERRTLKLFSR